MPDVDDSDPSRTFLGKFPPLHGRQLLVFLGRLHPKKGCDLAIDAFAAIAQRAPNLCLVLAGPDQIGWQTGLTTRAEKLGINSRVIFTGMLSGELKRGALMAADAFILPSHQENFGMAVVEALSLGVPVLISSSDGLELEGLVVVLGLELVGRGADDDDRLVEDVVGDVIADLLQLLDAAGHLPDLRPERGFRHRADRSVSRQCGQDLVR